MSLLVFLLDMLCCPASVRWPLRPAVSQTSPRAVQCYTPLVPTQGPRRC